MSKNKLIKKAIAALVDHMEPAYPVMEAGLPWFASRKGRLAVWMIKKNGAHIGAAFDAEGVAIITKAIGKIAKSAAKDGLPPDHAISMMAHSLSKSIPSVPEADGGVGISTHGVVSMLLAVAYIAGVAHNDDDETPFWNRAINLLHGPQQTSTLIAAFDPEEDGIGMNLHLWPNPTAANPSAATVH
jgi:hypothetical protein